MSSRGLFVGPLLHLRTLQAFEGLSSVHLTTLAQEVDEIMVERGTALLSPDQPAQDLHVVVAGEVMVHRGTRVESAGPGQGVGFLELLAQGPSGTSAVAQVDTLTLRLPGDHLRDVCERHFAILAALLSHVARQTSESPAALAAVVRGDPAAWPARLPGPLDRVGRMLALHRSPAFPSASMDALSELSDEMREVHLAVGAPLWRVGDAADSFFLLCEGTVRYHNPRLGWTVDVGPGGVPGLPSTLARGHRGVEASAVTPVVALRIASEPFLDVLEDHFQMAFELLSRQARYVLGASGES
jgi:CRP-like cAMP-binding protein